MKNRIFIRNILLFGLMLVVLVACPKYEYFTGSFAETPTNLSEFNTEYDEFRPIVRSQWDFRNDFMLFSSNRPGGKGGFDLYYVGIDKINKIE